MDPDSLLYILAFLITGCIAGMTAGLLGLGGGVVIVPILHFLFILLALSPDFTMQLAVGTSLATIVFTAFSSALTHKRLGNVQIRTMLLLSPGIVLGALAGAAIADQLSTEVLRRFFGLFEILVAIQIGFDFKPAAHRSLPNAAGLASSGGVIGVISSIMGIGGGSLTVPYLIWCNVDVRQAIGTSAACGLPIALAGVIGFIFTGLDNPSLPDWSLGYVYLPAVLCIISTSVIFAPVGARLANKLPIATLKKMFALLLAVIGLKMLL